jgi:hypothetical protein
MLGQPNSPSISKSSALEEFRSGQNAAGDDLDLAEDPNAPNAYLVAAKAEAARYHYEQAFVLIKRASSIAREPQDRFRPVGLVETRAQLCGALFGSRGDGREVRQSDEHPARSRVLTRGSRNWVRSRPDLSWAKQELSQIA